MVWYGMVWYGMAWYGMGLRGTPVYSYIESLNVLPITPPTFNLKFTFLI